MSKVSELHVLQEIDSELDGERAELAEVEAQFGETEELVSLRVEAEDWHRRLADIRKRLKDAEWQVQEMTEKIEPLNKKLYGGTVRNPKELADIQEDVNALMSRKRKLEDQELEVMAELEEAENHSRSERANLNAAESVWQAEQTRLQERKDALEKQIAAAEKRRGEQIGRIDAGSLKLYEELRAKHQGRAVARVERGMCQGCRISLPMGLLQKARSGGGETIVHCTSCERILYVS
jgi:hypothetical protein